MWEFFGIDSVVTKSGIGLFFDPLHHCSCPIVMQTRSNSACTLPDDENDNIYASDHTISPFEMTSDDSNTLIKKLLSGK